MKVNSETTIWKAKAPWSGQIKQSTKENLKTVVWRAKAQKSSQVVTITQASGRMICNTALVSTFQLKNKPRDKVSGLTARGKAGLLPRSQLMSADVPGLTLLLQTEVRSPVDKVHLVSGPRGSIMHDNYISI